ncbi:MAG: hypothetical protein LUE97_06945 [Oscillospiraceae bacterium]|nr:hypothetical protein [Oscillospiraceae bacterium]
MYSLQVDATQYAVVQDDDDVGGGDDGDDGDGGDGGDDGDGGGDGDGGEPDIPQTGQLNWPVPLLAVCGLLLFALGWVLKCGKKESR